MRFPGQYYDQETGLHYNWHRDYYPAAGRYIQSDPVGLESDVNLYAYVENNPSNWIDPLGLAKHATNSTYCLDLQEKIQNIRRDIGTRERELEVDRFGLPERIGPGERLRDTRRGHRKLINKLERRLRELEEKYDKECGGGNKPQECPEPEPTPIYEPSSDKTPPWWLPLLPFLTPWPDPY